MKKTLLSVFSLLSILFSLSSFSETGLFPITAGQGDAHCGLVPSYADQQFCAEFKKVTLCYCDEKFPAKLQPLFCPTVSKIYTQAMALYKTLPRLCQGAVNNGQSSSLTECENQWSCVMTGKTFTGGSCPANPGTNQPCQNIN